MSADLGDKIEGKFGEAWIKLASHVDVPEILALFDDAVRWLTERGLSGQWGTTPFSAIPNMHKQFSDWINKGTLFIARRDRDLAGTMVITSVVPSYAARLWKRFPETALYIEAFATARSMAGLGIGRDMLKWAEQYAEKHDKSVLWLDCWADNPDLCNYYKRAGYEARGLLVVNDWRAQMFEKQLSPVEAAQGVQSSTSPVTD